MLKIIFRASSYLRYYLNHIPWVKMTNTNANGGSLQPTKKTMKAQQ